MFVTEFNVDCPVLQDALAHAPETTVRSETQHRIGTDLVLLFWAEGADIETFEEHLSTDPTVNEWTHLSDQGERRLYRMTYTDLARARSAFHPCRSFDIILLTATATCDGWVLRMRIPSHEALTKYTDALTDRGLNFNLVSIYEQTTATETKADAYLSDAQREALIAARDLGYYEIPRQALLEDVAEECGVSVQSVSERLRRGTLALINSNLSG